MSPRLQQLESSARTAAKVCTPFTSLALTSDPATQLTIARTYDADRRASPTTPLWSGERYTHERIRLAYLSADFHEHATSHLMARLFELHDRNRFEVSAVSFGPATADPMRKRLLGAFEHFVDVRESSVADIARSLRRAEIDIAVDLKGLTEQSRPGIFTHRPAPVQVSYLGYPGTSGGAYFDYLLADEHVVPVSDFGFYTEKIVHLPDSYQVNDSQRRIAPETPGREACGLPAKGFVFACFNNSFKITQPVFNLWMQLLRNIESSVLWLFEDNPVATANLRQHAVRQGIAAQRLVFAQRLPLQEHLARHRLADLFLDTLPYNAHTTASDALWAGLPVLTCTGTTFAGRVATSLLHALGLSELITRSGEEYRDLALALATDEARLRAIRSKLEQARELAPLFDTDRFRSNVERAYIHMWERQQSGDAPAHFQI